MGSKTSSGPFGGNGGNSWDDGVYTTVRRIIISAGDIIDSICIDYDKNGESELSPIHGKSHGGEQHVVELDYLDEFLISISGYYGLYMDYGFLIQSLTFQTNKKTYGPFGREIGDQFSVPSTIGKIIGFFGRSGLFLDSIGVYIGPICISVGPYGFPSKSPNKHWWDDGVYTTVRQIILNVEEYKVFCPKRKCIQQGYIIASICIEYDQDGQSVWSPKHGTCEDNSDNNKVIKLHYPDEFLISFSGFYRAIGFHNAITSLTFHSNWKTYGPFGMLSGDEFSVPSNNGKIVGFYGESALNLCAIGARLEKFCPS